MQKALTGAAILAALNGGAVLAAPAYAGDFDLVLQVNASSVGADADFINDDKLDNSIDGALAGVELGAEYTFGDGGSGPFVGAHWSTTVGDGVTSAPIRNGNSLIHYTELEGFTTWDVRAGYDFGAFTAYAGWGELERDVVTYQSCPEQYESQPFGYCSGGGVPATGNAREGLRGGSPEDDSTELWRVGATWQVTERMFVAFDYAWADFDQSAAPLDVVGDQPSDRTAHSDTSLAQEFRVFSVGVGVRF